MVDWIFGKKKPVANFTTSEVKLTTNERATYAAQALNNPVFQEAIFDIKEELIDRWQHTASPQIEDREFYYVHMRALEQFLSRLNGFINAAKIEEDIREKRSGIKET